MMAGLVVGQQVHAVTASPTGSHLAALVDREVIKIVRVGNIDRNDDNDEPAPCTMETVRSYPYGRERDFMRLTINCIEWNPHESHEQLIAGGTTTGCVALWTAENLNHAKARSQHRRAFSLLGNFSGGGQHAALLGGRPSMLLDGDDKPPTLIRAHPRSVSHVCWHRESPTRMASCSKDGTCKLWDTRDPRQPINSIRLPINQTANDAVYSHLRPHMVAFGLDSGTMVIYDERDLTRPTWNKMAHIKSTLSTAWHPTMSHLIATSGLDRRLRVWNFEADRPVSSIQCISAASRIAWRDTAAVSTQIAANAISDAVSVPTDTETRVVVWDVKYPNVPARTLAGNSSYVTDLLWSSSSNAIYTGSRDGKLRHLPLEQGERPHAHLPSAALAIERHFDELASSHGIVPRHVGQDGDEGPAVESGDPIAASQPGRAMGHVRLVRSPLIGPTRAKVCALATEYKLTGGGRGSMCERNELEAKTQGDEEAASVWKLCAALELEAEDSAVAKRLRKRFVWNASCALSDSGNVQMASTLACVFREYRFDGQKFGEADHILRAAHVYIDMLESLHLEVEMRNFIEALGTTL